MPYEPPCSFGNNVLTPAKFRSGRLWQKGRNGYSVAAMIRAKISEILIHALIWTSVVVVVLLLWRIQEAILLAFGAIIIATLLRMLSDLVSRLTGFHPNAALAIAVALVAAIFGATFWILGANVSAQIVEVFNRAQAAEQQIRSELARSSIGGLIENLERQGSSTIGGVVTDFLATRVSGVGGGGGVG